MKKLLDTLRQYRVGIVLSILLILFIIGTGALGYEIGKNLSFRGYCKVSVTLYDQNVSLMAAQELEPQEDKNVKVQKIYSPIGKGNAGNAQKVSR